MLIKEAVTFYLSRQESRPTLNVPRPTLRRNMSADAQVLKTVNRKNSKRELRISRPNCPLTQVYRERL